MTTAITAALPAFSFPVLSFSPELALIGLAATWGMVLVVALGVRQETREERARAAVTELPRVGRRVVEQAKAA